MAMLSMKRTMMAMLLSVLVVLVFLISVAESSTKIIALAVLIGAGFGFAIVLCVASKPQLLWPILIVGSIVSTGFMLHGYTMVDEYIVGCIVIGGILASCLPSIRYQSYPSSVLDRLHRFIFISLIIYIIFQCFRGILILNSPKKIRWVVFYMMLGVLVFLINKRKYKVPSIRKISFFVLVASLLYFSFYLGYGILFEYLGVSRYLLQFAQSSSLFAIWGTTAYVMFPLVITMPVIIIFLKDRNRVYRRLGWITLLVSVCTAIYYDSRVAIFTITAFMLISLFHLSIRKWLAVMIICAIILGFFFSFVWQNNRDMGFFLSDVYGTIGRLQKAAQSGIGGQDIDRYIWMKAGFFSISDSWQHFLFGHGFRTSGYVVAPHVYNLFIKYEQPKAYEEDVATEAITNLLVDTGMIGLFLLIMNFVFVALQIWKQKTNPYKSIFMLSLIIIFGWLFVINIVDVMLFYLIIMPSGFFVQLSRYNPLKG